VARPGYRGVVSVVSTVAGVVLIVIALNDVFHTLLRPAATGRLTTFVFRGAHALAGGRPHGYTASGPLTVLAAIAVWVVLLAVGWTLIYLPHMPEDFAYTGVDPGQYHPLAEALTFSLVALTTLGLGDVVPADPFIRALSPLEALTGFALLTAAVSWFLQLYPALSRRRALAVELTGLTEAGVATIPPDVSAAYAATIIRSVSSSLAVLTADLVQNTEIFYFTERDERLSMARALGHALELRDAALASESPDVRAAARSLSRVLDELARVLTDQYPHVKGESTDEVFSGLIGADSPRKR
jgi:hypothetical protein